MGYRQLTQTQRYQIFARHDLGVSQQQIARELGIHNSTVSRELCRNATTSGYDPEQAQSCSDHPRRTARKWTKRLPSMIAVVADRLREEWSPQQISGFMAPLAGVSVSHQWIYSLIWDDKAQGGDLWRHLRQPKRRSKHRAWSRWESDGVATCWQHAIRKSRRCRPMLGSGSQSWITRMPGIAIAAESSPMLASPPGSTSPSPTLTSGIS